MKIALTNREADVMQVLWDHGPSLVAEVRNRLTDELAYTTVLTILRTLESKGYVSHEEDSYAQNIPSTSTVVSHFGPGGLRTIPRRR